MSDLLPRLLVLALLVLVLVALRAGDRLLRRRLALLVALGERLRSLTAGTEWGRDRDGPGPG